jgi:hypothetical protein
MTVLIRLISNQFWFLSRAKKSLFQVLAARKVFLSKKWFVSQNLDLSFEYDETKNHKILFFLFAVEMAVRIKPASR